MKPMRGLSGSWFSRLSHERRTTLISLAILTALLAGLAVFQRFRPLGLSPTQQQQLQYADRLLSPNDAAGQEVQTAKPERAAAVPTEAAPANQVAEAVAPRHLGTPLAGSHKVLRSFTSFDDAFGDFRLYAAIAYEANRGDAVIAAGAGTVTEVVEHHPLDGGVVTIDHGGGLVSRYVGLGKILIGKNAGVQAGSLIGQVGSPGPARTALGTHLRFQVLRNDEPEDPEPYFNN